MSFWNSELGVVSGNAEDAFTKSFGIVPDGTMALARIHDFKEESFGGKHYKIDWLLIDGDFKGQHVFQKVKAFDPDPKIRHKALNMLMRLFKMFHVKHVEERAPIDNELKEFFGKSAGIKILETKPNDQGKIYNYIGEVHAAEGFKSVTGERKIIASRIVTHSNEESLDSALNRQRRAQVGGPSLDEDIPWY